jgi:hypothetical protein
VIKCLATTVGRKKGEIRELRRGKANRGNKTREGKKEQARERERQVASDVYISK